MKRILGLCLCAAMIVSTLLAGSLTASASRLYGDVDLDGKVTTVDARLVLTGTVGGSLTDKQKKLGDMDADQALTSVDARMIITQTLATKTPTNVLDGNMLVTFGDSLTALGSWPGTLATSVNMYLKNAAMGGTTSAQGLERFDKFVGQSNADFVTLSFGMNDFLMTSKNVSRVSLTDFRKNMELLCAKVLQLNATPILMTVSYVDESKFYAAQGQPKEWYADVGGPNALLDRYNAVVREIASVFGYELADIRKECDKYTPAQFLSSDGIHLGTIGNKVYADTLKATMEAAYKRDHTVPIIVDPYVKKNSPAGNWTEEIVSHDPSDWFAFPATDMTFTKNADGSIAIANTTGLWPAAHYALEKRYVVPKSGSKLVYDFTVANVNTSIIMYFGAGSPYAYTTDQYLILNQYLGVKTNSIGDITENQTAKGSLDLSSLPLPSGAYDKNGNVVFSGIVVYAAGTARQPVTIRQMAVSSTGAPK